MLFSLGASVEYLWIKMEDGVGWGMVEGWVELGSDGMMGGVGE